MRVTVTNYECYGMYVGILGEIFAILKISCCRTQCDIFNIKNLLLPNTMCYFLVTHNYIFPFKLTYFEDRTVMCNGQIGLKRNLYKQVYSLECTPWSEMDIE